MGKNSENSTCSSLAVCRDRQSRVKYQTSKVSENKDGLRSSLVRHGHIISSKVQPDQFQPFKQICKYDGSKVPAALQERLAITAPSSVVTENSLERLEMPYFQPNELNQFGELYESNILQHIHRYLQLDAHHRVAYVGPVKGSLVAKIEKFFCLRTPISVLYPGSITYQDVKSSSKRLAFKVSHVGAEEFFTQEAAKSPTSRMKFDRILIIESVQHFYNMELTFSDIVKCVEKDGLILVVHRPSSLTTLPYFTRAKQLLSAIETPFMDIINALQGTGSSVQWELEHVPIIMAKMKWIAMLRNRYPTELELLSDSEVEHGIRELTEGMLKYLTLVMEIEDRLLFITGTPPTVEGTYPSVHRVGGASFQPYSALAKLKYTLDVTPAMEKLL